MDRSGRSELAHQPPPHTTVHPLTRLGEWGHRHLLSPCGGGAHGRPPTPTLHMCSQAPPSLLRAPSRGFLPCGVLCTGCGGGRYRRGTGPVPDAEPWAPVVGCLLPAAPGQAGSGLKCPLEGRAAFRPHIHPLAWWGDPGRTGPTVLAGDPERLRPPPSASRAQQDPTSTFTRIYKRSFCLLQAWVEDCYAVDFMGNAGLLGRLEDFISSKVTARQADGQNGL